MRKSIFQQRPIARFKRWTRTPYGIFASLHRQVEIGVLWVGMSILLPPSVANGQTTDTVSQRILLETIDVKGSRSGSVRSVTAPTVLIARSEGECATQSTLESALSTIPSLDIRSRGGEGVQADISIRGGSADQTMVMLGGIKFTDARTGHQSHSLPVDFENITEVELIDGLPSIGAYAGAIDISVRPSQRNTLKATVSGGEHNLAYANVAGTLRRKSWAIFGAVSTKRSDGYRLNTDFDNLNFYSRAICDASENTLIDIQVGYQNRDFGANGFYSLKYSNQFEHTSTLLGSARLVRQFAPHWIANGSVSYRRNHDRFELVRGDSSAVPYNYHLTDNFGAELWFDRLGMFGKTSVGGDYSMNIIHSTVLGEPLEQPVKSVDAKGVEYTKGAVRNVANLWIRQRIDLSAFDVTASFGAAFTLYGTATIWSAAASFKLGSWRSEFAAVKSMRLPTFTDLYYTARGYISNADLKPESAVTFSIGQTYAKNGFAFSAKLYYRRGNNVIDWCKTTDDDDWHSCQFTVLNTLGSEISVSQKIAQPIVFSEVKLSYGLIHTDKKADVFVSKYALDYMRNKLSLSIRSVAIGGFTLSATTTLFDRQSNYTDATGSVIGYRPYILADGLLNWRKGGVDIHLNVSNITSTDYFDYGGLPMPRRWCKVGISLTL